MSALTIDWGDVPTWVGAITTLGALIAAAVLVRFELRRDHREVDRLERAEQADKVAAWFDDQSARILVRNGSSLPIYNVRVWVISGAPGDELIEVDGAVPPGDMPLAVPRGAMGALSEIGLRLRFTDAAGRSWQRWFDGTLRRLPDVYARTMFVEAESRTDVVPPESGDQPPL